MRLLALCKGFLIWIRLKMTNRDWVVRKSNANTKLIVRQTGCHGQLPNSHRPAFTQNWIGVALDRTSICLRSIARNNSRAASSAGPRSRSGHPVCLGFAFVTTETGSPDFSIVCANDMYAGLFSDQENNENSRKDHRPATNAVFMANRLERCANNVKFRRIFS